MKYPVTTFVHIDDGAESSLEPGRLTGVQEPNANSTAIESPRVRRESSFGSQHSNCSLPRDCDTPECPSFSVGHISHLPRIPPNRGTYTVPSIMSKSIGTAVHSQVSHDDIFGMIKLKENDVCYTSGTIEWVGRKRSYPINCGFKILDDSHRHSEPRRKAARLDGTFTCGVDKLKECGCADVLPTVNAIVDHLNALHEAVDLVDLRLNTLEDVMSKNNEDIC